MLTVHQLSFSRGPRNILNGVDGSLRPGRVTALLGPNGTGKSTLLKLLAGELMPAGGIIEFGGKSLPQWNSRELAQRRAVLPQESHLAFAFPVREVVLMGRFPQLSGSETPHDREIVDGALARLELTALADRPYPALSGGEKQRVQLARVLAQIWEEPTSGNRYLLLDEPTAGLDLAHQHQILQTAQELAKAGAVVLAVLHDLNLAMTYADDVWVLENGKLAAAGPVEDVLQAPLIERVFQVQAELLARPNSSRPFIITQPRSKQNQ